MCPFLNNDDDDDSDGEDDHVYLCILIVNTLHVYIECWKLLLSDIRVKIEDFHYDKLIGDLMLKNIKHTKFQGMKGWVSFDKSGGSMSKIMTNKWISKYLVYILLY